MTGQLQPERTKSARGVVAAIVFLSALPLAALCQAVTGRGAEIVVHVALALGAAVMAVGVFDFRTARWVAWTGSLSLSVLAVIFLLQGLSELTRNEWLSHVAYQQLGQRLEAWAGDVFVLWCIAVLLMDSRGWTRIVGSGAIAAVVGMRGYSYYLSHLGTSLDAAAPALKVLALLPFVWLLLEAGQTARPLLHGCHSSS